MLRGLEDRYPYLFFKPKLFNVNVLSLPSAELL